MAFDISGVWFRVEKKIYNGRNALRNAKSISKAIGSNWKRAQTVVNTCDDHIERYNVKWFFADL